MDAIAQSRLNRSSPARLGYIFDHLHAQQQTHGHHPLLHLGKMPQDGKYGDTMETNSAKRWLHRRRRLVVAYNEQGNACHRIDATRAIIERKVLMTDPCKNTGHDEIECGIERDSGRTAAPDSPALAETMTTKLAVILGEDGVERLAHARVAVFGCGGVGSNCIEALARGGIGTLAIVDKDVVAPSNINRQAIAYQSTIGRRKIDVTEAMIHDINPACRAIPRHAFVLAENIEELLDELEAACGGPFDYIVDAIDTVSTKLAIAKLAQERGLPLISSMGGANKLHPECLRIADVHKTVNDSLSRIMRKECRKRGIHHLKVLYSCEEPMHLKAREGAARSERSDLGTASFMPPIMGQMIAGEVIRQISGVGTQSDTAAALSMHDAAQRGALAGRKGSLSKKKA